MGDTPKTDEASHVTTIAGASGTGSRVEYVLSSFSKTLESQLTQANADRDAALAEIERWKNITARKDPNDCAVGLEKLYNNWQTALAGQRAAEERIATFEQMAALREHFKNAERNYAVTPEYIAWLQSEDQKYKDCHAGNEIWNAAWKVATESANSRATALDA